MFSPPSLGFLLRASWRIVVCHLPCVGEWLAKGFAYPPGRRSTQSASLMCQKPFKCPRKLRVLGSAPRGPVTLAWQELGKARP